MKPHPRAESELRLPAILSDHMVLQAGEACRVWGWAKPGLDVRVHFDGQSQEARTDVDGRWEVILQPLQACSIGRRMVVASDQECKFVEDVVVGEVWLGSGQSNMAMRVDKTADAEVLLARAERPALRLFTVEWNGDWVPLEDVQGKWLVANADAVAPFSAVLYVFGRELSDGLKRPVGLINSSVGGSSGQAWVAQSAVLAEPRLPRLHAQIQQTLEEHPDIAERGGEYYRAWYKEFLKYWDALQAWQKLPEDTRGPSPGLSEATVMNMMTPGMFFNGMVAPLTPFNIRGVLWYQGEKNANSGQAYEYRYLLATLINCWRKAWGKPELPCYCVQLPDFDAPEPESWSVLRESIACVCDELSHTGMAVAIGLGDPKDIHPVNKTPVGSRLARLALAQTYERPVACFGPMLRESRAEDGRLRLHFNHCEGALLAEGDTLSGFEVAGDEGDFVSAQACIEGESVLVWNDEVAKPAYVRYAWSNTAQPSLFNAASLPASPFRTDKRRVVSQPSEEFCHA